MYIYILFCKWNCICWKMDYIWPTTCLSYGWLPQYSLATPRPISSAVALFLMQIKRLFHPSYCWRFVAQCCVICWVINRFPSLSSYVTGNRVDAHLFLHNQGIRVFHREIFNLVNTVKRAWRTHTRNLTHNRDIICRKISLNILLR